MACYSHKHIQHEEIGNASWYKISSTTSSIAKVKPGSHT